MTRLLALDGGGVRGLIGARVLAHLEKTTGKAVHQLFDCVAATSAGAIVAGALLRPDAKVGDAAFIADSFRAEASSIFTETWKDKLGAVPRWLIGQLGLPQGFDLNDVWSPRYQAKARREALERLVGTSALSEALLPLYITAYDTALRVPVIFVSRREDEIEGETFEATVEAKLLDAVMASTAAPVYFPPHQIRRWYGGEYSLVDGGVIANSPAQLAHAFWDGTRDDYILSLGTGSLQTRYAFDRVKDWGLISWAGPLLKMTLDGQSEVTHLALEMSMPASRYLRLQPLLEETTASDDLDDVRRENLAALDDVAEDLIDKNKDALARMADVLMHGAAPHAKA